MIPVITESTLWANRIYISVCGAIVAFVIGITLLSNTGYNYYKLWKESKKQAVAKRKAYAFVLVYLSLITVSSFSYVVLRTNMITRIGFQKWTESHCIIAYILSYFSIYLSSGVVYVIFVWRINTTLTESIYRYHPSISYIFYISICVMVIVWWINVVYELVMAEWRIVTSHGISLCANFVNVANDSWRAYYGIMAICSAIYHFVVNCSLLFMFVKGLWSINKSFIKSFVDEHIDKSSIEMNSNSSSPRGKTSAIEMNNLPSPTSKTSDIDTVLDKCVSITNDDTQQVIKKKETMRNVAHILKLHDLIKKQTILVFMAVVSSVFLWIMICIDNWNTIQLYWDVSVNSICVWLMLGSSEIYWKFCTKKGIFRCCYRKENTIKH